MDDFNFLDSILQQIDCKVLIQDQDGAILYPKNPILLKQLKNILNHPVNEHQELHLTEIITIHGSNFKKQYWNKKPSSSNFFSSNIHLKKFQKKSEIVYEVKQQKVERNGQTFFIKSLKNITEQKKQAEDLKLLAEDMISTLPVKEIFRKKLIEQFMNDKLNTDQGFAVIMGDIDHFKEVNDVYGHITGDQIIKEVGKIIKTTLKEFQKEDSLATRIGGEEFFIIIPDVSKEQEFTIVEAIRQKCEHSLRKVDPKITSNITISFGIYHTKQHLLRTKTECQEYIYHLRKAVDVALYISKINGRNRTTVCDDLLLRSLEEGSNNTEKLPRQKIVKKNKQMRF